MRRNPPHASDTMTDYSAAIQIAAPPEVVFAHLTTAEGMVAWMGQHADLDPTPGGLFAVDINGEQIRGTFLEIEPARRVVVTWGVAHNGEHPSEFSLVEFTLIPFEGGTRLELVHAQLPASQAEMYGRGWNHFLERLRLTTLGHDPGPDPFAPEPALRSP